MNLILSITTIALTCLAVGFAVGQVTANPSAPKRVTGIGGVFFKAKDPATLNAWYAKHLGIPVTKWGAKFEWFEADGPDGSKGAKASTAWTTFPETTKHFGPSDKPFMINYRVANLTGLLEELKKEGIEPVGEVQNSPYGAFAHIMDPEGNKIELWDPNTKVTESPAK